MLRFDFTNLMASAVGDENGLTGKELEKIASLVSDAHKKFQSWRESKDAIFYDHVFDDQSIVEMDDAAAEIAERFENIVVLGIGGSALGLRCASQALLPPLWNLMDTDDREALPRLFVCDNVDPDTISAIINIVDIKATCFVVISKSGKTTETAAQMFFVLDHLKKTVGDSWRKNIVIITDPQNGELRPFVKEEGLTSFAIPPKLGGRFSVLSPVGLFPAACVGIDIRGLIEGGRNMAKRCASGSLEENPAYQLGSYHHWFDSQKRKPMSVMIPYADSLALFADWYSQLWAESLGKNGKGPTPIKALGATDQHSQVQLYMEGPADKVFTFLATESFRTPGSKTRIANTFGSFGYLKGHDFGTIINAERTATATALAKASRPNLTIHMEKIDAHALGELFMAYEIATAFSGALYGINPFDQPGVELGKVLTKEILTKSSA